MYEKYNFVIIIIITRFTVNSRRYEMVHERKDSV